MNLLIDARRPLLAGLFEYSGLIGSNTLSLEEAVLRYREAVAGPHGWIIGRFLCPTSQLEELAALLTVSMKPGERPWHLAAVADEPLGPAAMHAGVFETYMNPAGSVTSIETTAENGPEADVAALATAAAGISPSVIAYLRSTTLMSPSEIPRFAAASRSHIQPIGALLATTSVTSHPEQVAEVIRTSAQLGVPLKLVSSEPSVTVSGFLRLVAAASLACGNAAAETLADVLNDDDPDAMTATGVGLRWRDQLFGAPRIQKARSTLQSWTCQDLDAAVASFVEYGLGG